MRARAAFSAPITRRRASGRGASGRFPRGAGPLRRPGAGAQANRNGFFYVLDRLTGQFLLGEPFVKKLTWASGIAPNGRPRVLPGAEPTVQGSRACPTVEGASNWMSTAYHPSTGLFYVMAL